MHNKYVIYDLTKTEQGFVYIPVWSIKRMSCTVNKNLKKHIHFLSLAVTYKQKKQK